MSTPLPIFEEVDVSGWRVREDEPMGTKPKQWVQDGAGTLWLFKRPLDTPGREHRGEDWAEKIAAEIGVLIGIPCARVEFAQLHDTRGVIVRTIRTTSRTDLVLGNELLSEHLRRYTTTGRLAHEHRLEHIVEVLSSFERRRGTVRGRDLRHLCRLRRARRQYRSTSRELGRAHAGAPGATSHTRTVIRPRLESRLRRQRFRAC